MTQFILYSILITGRYSLQFRDLSRLVVSAWLGPSSQEEIEDRCQFIWTTIGASIYTKRKLERRTLAARLPI